MDFGKFLADYIACKSVSADPLMKDEMLKASAQLVAFFKKLGLEASEINLGHNNVVFAKTEQKNNKPTILIYGHYDVQPADDVDLWESDPFVLTKKKGRLYARGASDDKGPVVTILSAVYDLISSGRELPINLKFVIEGEEEIGSVSMPSFLQKMKQELAADFALVADTWSLDEENIVITSGLRGLVGCEIEVIGQQHDLHSGYGGCILNPIQAIVDICSKLHTADGLVNLPGFYDDVKLPSDWERAQMKRLPLSDDDIKKALCLKSIKVPDVRFSAAEAIRFLPTLEFNGIKGGFQGDGIKTIIPCRASAKISCRLVPNQDAEKIKEILSEELKSLCPKEMSLSVKFEQSTNPYWLDIENQQNKVLKSAMSVADVVAKEVFKKSPVYLRDGGSIGLVTLLKSVLGTDSLLVGLSTTEDSIHAPNESIAISMLENGRKFFRMFLSNFKI